MRFIASRISPHIRARTRTLVNLRRTARSRTLSLTVERDDSLPSMHRTCTSFTPSAFAFLLFLSRNRKRSSRRAASVRPADRSDTSPSSLPAIVAMIIHAQPNITKLRNHPLVFDYPEFTGRNWKNTCPDARRNGANDVNAILKRSDCKDRVLAISPMNSRATMSASRCNRV